MRLGTYRVYAGIINIVLATIDGLHATPVEDDVVDKLIDSLAVMVFRTNTIEAGRTADIMGKQTVVHGATLAAPLGTVCPGSLTVLRAIQSLGKDTPLCGGVFIVVECQVFLHRPRERTMVNHDVLYILYTQWRHTPVRQIAGTEAQIAKDCV